MKSIEGQFIDPKQFNISPSTKLIKSNEKEFVIIITRKSRIIMKDGKGILDKANKIKKCILDAKINLKTSAPVCSKTKSFLMANDINVFT